MGPGHPAVSRLCPGRGIGAAAWIAGHSLEHHSVWLLEDHNLTPSRGTGDCQGASENVSTRGNKGPFVGSKASRVFSLFWLVVGASMIQDAVTPLVTSFKVKDSSFCCERLGWLWEGGPSNKPGVPTF